MYDQNNIFAKIIRKEISSESIYEDKEILFINDINPMAKIHILAITKLEVVDFSEFILKANEKTVNHFFFKVHEIIKMSGIEIGGYKLITNSGRNGGQEIPHFHLHILGGQKLK
jgi:diadenosine tetraphosphate (Ap4A) HIT family hydrolase